MKRIDSDGATENNLFTEGNPATGTPATVVSADWLNHVQEELVGFLGAFDVSPDPESMDQLAGLIGSQSDHNAPAGVRKLVDLDRQWQAPGWKHLETVNANGESGIDFVLPSGFSLFQIIGYSIDPSDTNGPRFGMRVNTSGSSGFIDSEDYARMIMYMDNNDESTQTLISDTTEVRLGFDCESGAGTGAIRFDVLFSQSQRIFRLSSHFLRTTGVYEQYFGHHRLSGGFGGIEEVRLFFSSGNIASGTMHLMGYRG